MIFRLTLLILIFLFGINCRILLRDPVTYKTVDAAGSQHPFLNADSPYKYKEEYYEGMPIDHFSFVDNRTFSLRYFINTDNYQPNSSIFFYTGNEGHLESFATNTGFMWDIAPEYNAAVVFAEHRFYGKTLPFGNKSFDTVQNLGYLSSEQALADFAQLITYLKNERIPHALNSSVIAFGGSYGGMLTAWMRIKYPHLVDGGIAASAPVFWFNGTNVPHNIYDRIVKRTFYLAGCNPNSLIASFRSIQNLGKTEEGRNFLNKRFHLSEKSKVITPADADLLINGIKDVMETIAMVNYPYPANFLSPLPAWPIKASCKFFPPDPSSSDKVNALASYNILNVYYNTSGTEHTLCVFGECPGPSIALGDSDAWLWQTCTEMQMPICSSGPPNDIFNHDCPFSFKDNLQYCLDRFGPIGFTASLYRPNWAMINYGSVFKTATNIIFSNGYLDPWSGGGWSLYPFKMGSLVSIVMEDGAHHLDLRGANPADTISVNHTRLLEKKHISRWILEAQVRYYLRSKNLIFRNL